MARDLLPPRRVGIWRQQHDREAHRAVHIPRGQSRNGPGGRGWLVKKAATSQASCAEMGAAPSSTPKGILACTKALAVVSRFMPAAELNEPSPHTGGVSYPS